MSELDDVIADLTKQMGQPGLSMDEFLDLNLRRKMLLKAASDEADT